MQFSNRKHPTTVNVPLKMFDDINPAIITGTQYNLLPTLIRQLLALAS